MEENLVRTLWKNQYVERGGFSSWNREFTSKETKNAIYWGWGFSPEEGSVAGDPDCRRGGGWIHNLWGFLHFYGFMILKMYNTCRKNTVLSNDRTGPFGRGTTHLGCPPVITWQFAVAGTLLTLLSDGSLIRFHGLVMTCGTGPHNTRLCRTRTETAKHRLTC